MAVQCEVGDAHPVLLRTVQLSARAPKNSEGRSEEPFLLSEQKPNLYCRVLVCFGIIPLFKTLYKWYYYIIKF